MITKKENIIEYFKSGIKTTNELKIGVEHEKFILLIISKKVVRKKSK